MRITMVLVSLLLSVWASGGARIVQSLNGQWEFQRVGALTEPPRGGEWKACSVPGYLRGHDYQRAWFRRSFTVPAGMKGQRIKIRFGGVKYNCRVLVNGRRVGGCFGGYQPFEVDVTDAVRLDGPNELSVGVHDWTGIFTEGPKVDFTARKDWTRIRGIPHDRILAPIGGLYALYGIWDDVTLRSHPAVYVKDVTVRTSVRRKELSIEYELANESGDDAVVNVMGAVEGEGKDLTAPRLTVRVPAKGTAKAKIAIAGSLPRLWSYVDPYLYTLHTTTSTGDGLQTRFGFREFWVDGHRFVLNGVPVNLLATSWWPPHAPMTREQIKERWLAIKKAGCVAFRTHTQPWRPVHYEVADEVGLLMIPEGAIWNDDGVYRVNDPIFWDNYAKHLKAMVANLKNHASVVMWSLENEFTGQRMNDKTEFPKAQLARMGKLMKQWDPRPIFYESDGDPHSGAYPHGVADAIGIHYPHEYPDHTCWPNEAFWLDTPWKGHGGGGFFLNGQPHFLWKRDKPLYVGEFLWLPSSNPSWHTVFFGDEAYVDYRRYRNLGKAESWKMQIIGYRCQDVAGISPWTMIEGGKLDETNPLYRAHQYAYQAIAAYCLDYDRCFYGGQTIRRRVEVFNDVMAPSDLSFEWTLVAEGKPCGHGVQKLTLGPAEHRTVEVKLSLPRVAERTALDWRLTLTRDGRQAFDDTHRYGLFPQHAPSKLGGARFGAVDAGPRTEKMLLAHGVKPVAVRSLSEIPDGIDVLVLGEGCLRPSKASAPVIGRTAPEREAVLRFAERGGRVLVLAQEVYPEGLFDFVLTRQNSTMTFAARPDHPALRGVGPANLKFWSGGHRVATSEPPRPSVGGYVPIIVSGSRAGVANAPLLERRMGKGCIVFSQLESDGPIADRIRDNLLGYLASYKGSAPKTAVVGGSPAYHDYLCGLGLRFDDLTGKLGAADLSAYSLIVCRGEAKDVVKLKPFVEAGGNVVFHRTPVGPPADAVCRAFGIGLTLQPYGGHAVRAEGSDPLLSRFLREDLYWLGTHEGIGWATTPLATGVADAVIGKTLDTTRSRSFEAESWTLEGQIVEKRAPGVVFATVGSVTGAVEFPASGTYVIGLVASGSPAYGVFPQASITVGGRMFGVVATCATEWRTYTAFGHVEKGRHKVTVAFTNDGSNPPQEDRNLFLDRILVAADTSPKDVTFLTSPPTVAIVRRGKGRVVLEQMRWDTESANARKAARYAAALFTEMGGDFAPRPGVALECEAMTPQEGMNHYRAAGATAHLACAGYVGTKVVIGAAGRYTMEVVASGTDVEGVFPHVRVTLDGKPVGEVQLTSGGWRAYPVTVTLPAGEHELRVHFTNDQSIPGVADRNLALDKVVFYRE